MYPLPTPGTGKFVVARGQLRIEKEWRTAGAEVPEAWDWPASALHAHLQNGTLSFVPHPPFDVSLPARLLERMPVRELRDVCEELELDDKGKKDELVLRILQRTGFAPPDPVPPMETSPRSSAPSSTAPEPSTPSPTQPVVENASPADVLRSMSVHELRANVAPIYGVTIAPGETREEALAKILVAAGYARPPEAPSSPSSSPSPAPEAPLSIPAASSAPEIPSSSATSDAPSSPAAAPAPEAPSSPPVPSDVPPIAGGLAID